MENEGTNIQFPHSLPDTKPTSYWINTYKMMVKESKLTNLTSRSLLRTSHTYSSSSKQPQSSVSVSPAPYTLDLPLLYPDGTAPPIPGLLGLRCSLPSPWTRPVPCSAPEWASCLRSLEVDWWYGLRDSVWSLRGRCWVCTWIIFGGVTFWVKSLLN